MKNTVTEQKNTKEELNNILKDTEKRIHELRAAELIQSLQKKEKKDLKIMKIA